MRGTGTSKVVLIAEDEWLVRDTIALELRKFGWDVLETSTAEGAIGYLRDGHHIDVLFTDIQLAGHLSGWDLAEHFRATRLDFPVVYTSGNSVDRSRKVQGSIFIEKPYKATAVLQACRSLL